MEVEQQPDNIEDIPTKEKLSFFLVNIGNIPIMTLISAFLLIFYTDVVGLNPAIIAIIFLITRIIDGISDPIMGYLIDHLPKTKWGRYRLYIILGCIICSINYIALWLAPAYSPVGKYNIAFITYLLLGFTFDLMDIPLNSMIPVMSEGGETRNKLAFIKSMGYSFGGILFFLITIPIISSFPTPLAGYTVLIIFTSVFVVLATTIGTLGIKERIEPIEKERYKAKDVFKVLSSRPVLTHFISSLLSSIAAGASTAAMLYFLTYIVGDPGLIGLLVISTVIGGFFGLIIGHPILKKYGKKYTIVAGTIISGISTLFIALINPTHISLLFLITFISAIGGGFGMIVGYGLQADNTDYVEWKLGIRTEGVIASLVSFVNKAGLGIGAAITAVLLAISGYIPNVSQSPSAIKGIYLAFIIVPSILNLIGGSIILFFYPLTKKRNEEIALELKQRRNNQIL